MTNLPPMIQTFVLHFGEMGSRWGINRTVGQMFALLYLSEKPLNADQIVEKLGFSRSSVAMGIKELLSMNLIHLKHLLDDRKDYYATHDDIWDVCRTLAEERRKREIEPTLSLLRSTILEQPISEEEIYAKTKMNEMHDLIEMLTDWYKEIQTIDNQRLIKLMKLGAKVYQLYKFKDKLSPNPPDPNTSLE